MRNQSADNRQYVAARRLSRKRCKRNKRAAISSVAATSSHRRAEQLLVTRSMEDFVTWVDGSKIKRAIKTYEDKVDDFDLLGEG